MRIRWEHDKQGQQTAVKENDSPWNRTEMYNQKSINKNKLLIGTILTLIITKLLLWFNLWVLLLLLIKLSYRRIPELLQKNYFIKDALFLFT